MKEQDSFSIKKEWLDKIKQESFAMRKEFFALVFNFGYKNRWKLLYIKWKDIYTNFRFTRWKGVNYYDNWRRKINYW